MRPFTYRQASSVSDMLAEVTPGSAYLAGGTTLVDLMKLEVRCPVELIDINHLPLRGIEADGAGLTLGATERMGDVARHPAVRRDHPMLAQALLAGASQQLRNMATLGGNLLQSTRCNYFRDPASACNRRQPGSGCAALGGANRNHAVLGTSQNCVATHPSDLAVALVALDAQLHLVSDAGARTVTLAEFYRLPGDQPEVENDLRPGELITGIHVPAAPPGARETYLKIRDRASYEFAVASAAVRLVLAEGRIASARVAVGGVATIPWRLPAVEAALVGCPAQPGSFADAVKTATDGAQTLSHNSYKLPLLQGTLVRALEELMS